MSRTDLNVKELLKDTGFYIGPSPYKNSLLLVTPIEKEGTEYGFPEQLVQVIDYMKMTDGTYMVEGQTSFVSGASMDEAALEAVLKKASWLRIFEGQTLIHEEFGKKKELKRIVSKVGGMKNKRSAQA